MTSLNEEQVHKAVAALLKYIKHNQEERNELLEDDDLLYLASGVSYPCMLARLHAVPSCWP